MSDIVERLRVGICYQQCRVKDTASGCECAEAAARIQQLEAALKMFACACADEHLCSVPENCRNYLARAALGEKP